MTQDVASNSVHHTCDRGARCYREVQALKDFSQEKLHMYVLLRHWTTGVTAFGGGHLCQQQISHNICVNTRPLILLLLTLHKRLISYYND